jgi:hypothetical protein
MFYYLQPNRVSIQAITNKGATSKPQECTLLFGSSKKEKIY